MKRTTWSSFGVSKASGYKRMPPHPARTETPPPPPAILAPFLNTGEDSRPAAGPAPRIHIIPITVEPRTSPADRSSHMTSDARGQTSKESGTTSSQESGKASGKASGIPSSVMSDPGAMSATSQRTKLSGTRQKSHSLPLTDKPKSADLTQRSLMRGGENSLLPFCGCLLVLLVFLVLLCFMLWTDYDSHRKDRGPEYRHAETDQATQATEHTTEPNLPPAPPTPAAGHVGAPCSETDPCLGEAQCVNGACWCKGPGFRVVKGICVFVTTPATKKTRSPKSTTSPWATTLPFSARITFVRIVRPATTATNAITETTPGTPTGEERAEIVAEVDGTLHDGDDSPETAVSNATVASNVTAAWNVTAQSEEGLEKRGAPPD
ncbi:uncharacterized protein [Dermacentor albipictus]|uniref:uncharacterized protein isoform X2 n=1 Tax=Dermacentor albipictus TaxID=60249 RepID=UPI0031FC5B52